MNEISKTISELQRNIKFVKCWTNDRHTMDENIEEMDECTKINDYFDWPTFQGARHTTNEKI